MDERRLNTAALMGMGILNVPTPKTDIPKDREEVRATDLTHFEFIGIAAVIEAIEAGKVVESSNYYGIPHVWKEAEGVYRGTLLQYRNVTENPTFATAADAAAWFRDMYYQTDG